AGVGVVDDFRQDIFGVGAAGVNIAGQVDAVVHERIGKIHEPAFLGEPEVQVVIFGGLKITVAPHHAGSGDAHHVGGIDNGPAAGEKLAIDVFMGVTRAGPGADGVAVRVDEHGLGAD